ncbi:recombinase family protein [Pantoea hericii]|uniref:recombinase family protein n=1 Tax=Pantoea hericii TaxID=1815628 RepID=UPI002872D9D9|nr:recombinase family protein [Pantoea hericii]
MHLNDNERREPQMNVITYKRVSTEKQGKSGLGMEAQEDYITTAVAAGGWCVVGEYEDVGVSGALAPMERPGLRAALEHCKRTGAGLLVAKVDRLSRSVKDVATVMEIVSVLVATMPGADNFQIHLFAALAEQERDFIKSRTKAALQALKTRAAGGDTVAQEKVKTWSDNIQKVNASGANRGASVVVRKAKADAFAATVADNILAARARGAETLQAVADYLNGKGIKTRRGGEWTATQVMRIEKRA